MFLSHYKLKSKPFQISSDPKFLWLGEKHKEALATLRYGITDNKGFLLLTGDVGTGKTTLINTLIQSLESNVLVAVISDPGLSPLDFFNYIAHVFGLDEIFTSKIQFVIRFSAFLHEVYEKNNQVLLIIDESQRLSYELLEEIRLLSNIEMPDVKLLNIFFVGQNEFNEMLFESRNRALRQRLTLNYNIENLDADETGAYIDHRLKIAGSAKKIFTSDAVHEIHRYSGGAPRQINVICDLALLTGFVQDRKKLDREIVLECVEELKLPEKITDTGVSERVENLDIQNDDPPAVPAKTGERKTGKVLSRIASAALLFAGILFYVYWLYPDVWNSWLKILPAHVVETSTKAEKAPARQETDNLNDRAVSGKLESGLPVYKDPVEAIPVPEITSAPEAGVEQESSIVSAPLKTPAEREEPSDTGPMDKIPEEVSGQDDMIDEFQGGATENEAENHAAHVTAGEKTDAGIPAGKHETLEQPAAELDLSYLSRITRVYFSYNSNDLPETVQENVTRISDILIRDRDKKVMVTGYSDSLGSAAYNRQLSVFRANIIKSFMIGRGAWAAQVVTEGRGAENPLESNETAYGRKLNRRVEIQFIP